MQEDISLLTSTLAPLREGLEASYSIDEELYSNQNIKRGLRNADGTGVLAGVTRLGSVQGYMMEDGERVPMPGRLYYRGINVEEIIDSHVRAGTFGYEEVAYLLLLGKLPTEERFDLFRGVLATARELPEDFVRNTIYDSPSRDVMNKLQQSVLALYSYDPAPDDTSIDNLLRQSIELVARFPSIVANAYAVKRHHFDGKSLYLHNPKGRLSVSENFLRMVRPDKTYTDEESHLLDLMLILHAEHGGGNNSAFVCRTLSSSLTDTYSAIAGAVGALKGPLHGGANKRVTEMFRDIKENLRDPRDDEELSAYLDKLLDGTAGDRSGKIYGLGHAVYTVSDPRAVILKKYARGLAERCGRAEDMDMLEKIEAFGTSKIMVRKHQRIPLCGNVDLYSGLIYSMLGIPEELFTPLFATARISGWCAHRIEEIMTGGRLVRPAYRAALLRVPYVPMEKREA